MTDHFFKLTNYQLMLHFIHGFYSHFIISFLINMLIKLLADKFVSFIESSLFQRNH